MKTTLILNISALISRIVAIEMTKSDRKSVCCAERRGGQKTGFGLLCVALVKQLLQRASRFNSFTWAFEVRFACVHLDNQTKR